jgi:DNA-binding NarL/FixJ family response regulator
MEIDMAGMQSSKRDGKLNARSADGLLRLIDDVYSAAAGERPWEELAPEIARTFDSTSAALQIQRRGESSTILSATDNVKARLDDYKAYYWQRDIWVERAAATIGLSQVGSSADLIPDREFAQTEFYRDWCRHLGVFYVMGSVFAGGPGELGVLGIHRPRSSGSYKALDQHRVSRFLPHLRRALRLWEQLGRASLLTAASVEVLARCPTAALVVTGDGRLLYANSRAIEMLEDGSAIRSRQGRISASRDIDAAKLLALIRAASNATTESSPQDGVMLAHRPCGAAVSLLVAPLRVSVPGHASAGAIVFARDPAKTGLARETLQTLFDLTPTESRIAAAMARGRSVEAIAANQHASLQTVRKQVKAIFAKTGTHRQAECVAMILHSVAAMHRT